MELDSELKDIMFECYKSTKVMAKLLFPDRFFLPFSSKLHDKIFEVIDNDEIKKVVIAAPRGIGKTSIMNLVYPARNILFRQKRYIVPISCSSTAAIEQSENLKHELVMNPLIKKLFMCQKSDSWSQDEWIVKWFNSEGVLEYATKVFPRGAEQQVRGMLWGNYRPDLILVDDLEDPLHIDSDEQRSKKKKWFFDDVMKSVLLWSKEDDKSHRWLSLIHI